MSFDTTKITTDDVLSVLPEAQTIMEKCCSARKIELVVTLCISFFFLIFPLWRSLPIEWHCLRD